MEENTYVGFAFLIKLTLAQVFFRPEDYSRIFFFKPNDVEKEMVNNIFKVIRSLFVGLWGNKSSSVYEKNSTWIEEESFVLCCDKVVKRAVSLNISCVNKLASKDLLMEYIKNENELYRFWCFLDVYIINIKQVPNISCFFFVFFFTFE